MNRRRPRYAPAFSVAEGTLESRIALSGVAVHPMAEVGGHAARNVSTHTTVTANPGTLGQPITFTVTVRAPARAGTPQGTVNLVDHGQVLKALTLSPTTTSGKFAYSEATTTLTPQPGGGAFFFGRYSINANFVPSSGFLKSTARTNFSVNTPPFTTLSDGVQTATIAHGSGPAIHSGQTAGMLYTGYLTTGQIFDDSSSHGGAPLSFTLGAGQVIPGFEAAVAGMQVGESRVVVIPPSQGYGSTANGQIPANSTLIFVLTLTSIS